MFTDGMYFVAGLVLIIHGGNWFVGASVRIAEFLHMPRVVIGSTLVSLATTSPELVVSMMAGLKGESGLAVGNAVGSCICNIGLVMGLTASIKDVDVHLSALKIPLTAMFLGGALLFFMSLDLRLSQAQGALLVLAGVTYFAWDFRKHYRDRKPQDMVEAAAIKSEAKEKGQLWLTTPAGTAVQFLFGAGVVVMGSRWLVSGAVNIAAHLGIPSMIVGLTVVAIGTSLPELTTAITSSRQRVSDLSVGNVLGANIANLTLIVGAASVIHEVRIDRLTQLFNFPATLAIMLLLLWMLFTERRITRREGTVLLGAYCAYITTLILLTIWKH